MTAVFCTAKTCNYNKYHDEDYDICQRTKIILDENVDSIFEGCPNYKDKPETEPMNDLIKRTDAIKWFEPYADRGLKIPVETVIQNLKDIPSAEEWKDECDRAYSTGWIRGMESAEPKQGEWIITEQDNGHKWTHRKCSECGKGVIEPLGVSAMKFCPNCGAKMKGADDE